jgi:hypothetical protein
MPKKLTDEIVRAAIDGLTVRKTRLKERIAELHAMLDGGSPHAAVASEPAQRKGRRMSAAARRRIAAAQRLRWAKIRGESVPAAPPTTNAKPKRTISPEGLKRIIAATKKRWRLQRAATKTKVVRATKRKAA